MVVRKHRKISYRLGEMTAHQVVQMLSQIDSKAATLWQGFGLEQLVHSAYFRNICLSDSNEDYFCELIVRFDRVPELVTITYHEKWT